jgi:hypothetical protein
MKHVTILISLLIFLVASCDSGGGDSNEVEQPTGPPTTKKESAECTKTAHCVWGEWCTNNKCAVPGEAVNLAKDFTVQDHCPGSQTYQQNISLSDNLGKVTLLYFATTTCAACIADVKEYESMLKQLEYKGFTNSATMTTVILPFGGSDMAGFTNGLQFPVVLDEAGVGIADYFGAGKDAVVLLDGAGYIRATWPSMEMRGSAKDKPVLNDALTELVQEVI